MGRMLFGAVATLVIAAILGMGWTLGGWVDVRATNHEWAPVAWLIHATYEKAVTRRAAQIEPPADLGAEAQVIAGGRAFEEMCSVCHTPPGRSPTVQSQGLNPPPPDAADLLQQRTSAEAFWVIENGVRMTGMPAFGPTHDDEQLWQLVAFLERAKTMDSRGYQRLMERVKREMPPDDGHAHRHGGGTPRASTETSHGEHVEPAAAMEGPAERPPAHGHAGAGHDH